jgi:hypothetical protein
MRRSRTTTPTLAACIAVVAACLVLAAPAAASPDQEAILQDDPMIVYEDDAGKLNRTLGRIASLGIDTVRVSLFWHLVAPNPTSRRRPSFEPYGAEWPGSYSEDRWRRYDRIVELAHANGLNVLLSISGPAPRWATRGRYRNINNYRPNPTDFRHFVRAVGGRYSGTWREGATTPEEQVDPLPVEVPGTQADPQPAPGYLPRVTRWSLWNEPNFPGWLLPQWKRLRRNSYRARSPHIYRRLVDAAWAGLRDSAHAGDLVLLGETAPYGPRRPRRPGTRGLMSPPDFVRELYCVTRRYRPYRGRAARARSCPSSRAGRRRFRRDHPALFEAAGWAHHAYSLKRPPTFRGRRRDAAPLGALGRLTRALDRAQFRWGAASEEMPIWITEYGYQTLPPDPFRGVSWTRQAAWMSWAEYLMYRNRRVKSFAQFLLVDDAPRMRYPRNDVRRWVTWQSGFITTDGQQKPAFDEFRRPIHVTPARARRGRRARVFGIFRTAAYGVPIQARIEFAPPSGSWSTLASVEVTNPRGYLDRRVRPPRTGLIRIVWTDPATGVAVPTRAQYVTRR